jgi:Transposase IS116/IS110/IS902 family
MNRISSFTVLTSFLNNQSQALCHQKEKVLHQTPIEVHTTAEIGTIDRFKDESGLALYLGMAALDNSSGRQKGTKTAKHVNTRAKTAMMVAVDRHRKYVPESQTYYEKKRAEGKKHNQAVRTLGRHLCRVIFKMLKQEKDYQIRK